MLNVNSFLPFSTSAAVNISPLHSAHTHISEIKRRKEGKRISDTFIYELRIPFSLFNLVDKYACESCCKISTPQKMHATPKTSLQITPAVFYCSKIVQVVFKKEVDALSLIHTSNWLTYFHLTLIKVWNGKTIGCH